MLRQAGISSRGSPPKWLHCWLLRDGTVRQMAWQMVAQLPTAALLAALTPEAWRSLFDAALVTLPRLHSEVARLLRSCYIHGRRQV